MGTGLGKWRFVRWTFGVWCVVYLLHDPKGAAALTKVVGGGLLHAAWQIAAFATALVP
jgi:hypothetical protein